MSSQPMPERGSELLPQFVSPEQVAKALQCSTSTVLRMFRDRPGVFKKDSEEDGYTPGKKARKLIRIPLEMVLEEIRRRSE